MNIKQAPLRMEWDRLLAREIINYALKLSSRYDLYVAVGNPKGIRNIASRAFSRGRRYRSMIHKWAFSRIISALEHGFALHGWSTGRFESRFLAVYEGRTSITCSKCGHRGVRPKQNLFVCHTCGFRTNADKNGAINIARRLIRLNPRLKDERNGLGRWLYPRRRRPSPKAVRKLSSERKSRLSQRSPALPEGESAVVRFVQSDLLSPGDGAGESDEGPAVGNAAGTLSVTGCLDSPRTGASGVIRQQKEATS